MTRQLKLTCIRKVVLSDGVRLDWIIYPDGPFVNYIEDSQVARFQASPSLSQTNFRLAVLKYAPASAET